jgi:hypothetical protein
MFSTEAQCINECQPIQNFGLDTFNRFKYKVSYLVLTHGWNEN